MLFGRQSSKTYFKENRGGEEKRKREKRRAVERRLE